MSRGRIALLQLIPMLPLTLAIACAAPVDSEPQPVSDLAAFARLYGLVRFFHPSDEASAIDWDRFAVHGVERVRVRSGDQKDAESTGDAKRDGDMNAEGDQSNEADDQQYRGIDFEHRTNPAGYRTRPGDRPDPLRNSGLRA